jgi:hypothetical protein
MGENQFLPGSNQDEKKKTPKEFRINPKFRRCKMKLLVLNVATANGDNPVSNVEQNWSNLYFGTVKITISLGI